MASAPGLAVVAAQTSSHHAPGQPSHSSHTPRRDTSSSSSTSSRNSTPEPERVWELDSSEAIKRAARAGLGISFLSRYAVLEEIDRGDIEGFRLGGQPRMSRSLYTARLARRPLTPSEKGFVATLTRCCSKNEQYAAACLA